MNRFSLYIKMLLSLSIITLIETNDFFSIAEASPLPDFISAPSLEQKETNKITSIDQTGLPSKIQSAVLEDASKRTTKTVNGLRIIDAQKRSWSDGCLGLAEPDQFCTQVITPGWQVLVTDGNSNWVYRTNILGNLVKLAESAD